jgi:hypothetical protein
LRADLRASGAYDRHRVGFLIGPNMRNAAHPNDRLPLMATVGSA